MEERACLARMMSQTGILRYVHHTETSRSTMTVAVFPPLLFFLARSHSPAIVARKSSLFPRKIQIVPGNLKCAFYSYLWSVGVAARVLFQ